MRVRLQQNAFASGVVLRAMNDLLLALAVFAFASSITPGPNNLMLMASGVNFGLARTLPHLMGVTAGFTLMIVLVGLGVAGVLRAAPWAFFALKLASAAALLYLAWKIATAAPPTENAPARGAPMTFLQAALFQWINPKAWIMALTAVTAYLPEGSALTALVAVALVFGLINLPSCGLWALAGVQMRRLLKRPRALRAFNVAAALLLVATIYPIFAAQAV